MNNKYNSKNTGVPAIVRPVKPPAPAVTPEDRPLDKVKRPTEKKRSREWER